VKPIYVRGLGLFTPGFADVTAWREGRPDASVEKPRCQLVDARLKRGSSRFANMLGEVVEQAASEAGLDVRTVPTVYGSSLGEIETMCILLRMLYEEEGKLSPNRFKNSVHNAASGLLSIATSNTAFTTAIAGGERSFETSLLETWAYVDENGGSAILAVADDRPPEPLDKLGDHGALAIAFALSAEPGDEPHLRLSNFRRAGGPIEARARVPKELAPNCAAAGLELLEAVLARRAGTISLALPGRVTTCLDLDVLP
jgi:hypothetical protein